MLQELQEECNYCLENTCTCSQHMTIKVFQLSPKLIYHSPDTSKPQWLVTQPRPSVSLLPWQLLSEKGKHNTTKINTYPLVYINNHFYPSLIKLYKNIFMPDKQTCWELFPLPTSPVFRGEVVDTAPVLNPGLVMVGVVAPAFFSAGKNPVADIGTTSKNCF